MKQLKHINNNFFYTSEEKTTKESFNSFALWLSIFAPNVCFNELTWEQKGKLFRRYQVDCAKNGIDYESPKNYGVRGLFDWFSNSTTKRQGKAKGFAFAFFCAFFKKKNIYSKKSWLFTNNRVKYKCGGKRGILFITRFDHSPWIVGTMYRANLSSHIL